MLPALVLLGGCSGLGHFLGDTAELPGSNPNGTTGISENLQRVRGHEPATEAVRPQPGNVWPGPPQPLPTLSDVSRGTLGGGTGPGGGALGGDVVMPKGGSMSMGEQNAVRGGAPLGDGFSGGGLSNSIADPAAHYRNQAPDARTPENGGGSASGSKAGNAGNAGNGNIVIPNGDGTSTVISPDGSVKTIKGTPR